MIPTTSIFIKQNKPSQKYRLTTQYKYINAQNIAFIVNKQNQAIGYQYPINIWHAFGTDQDDTFKRDCGLTPKTFNKRVHDKKSFFYYDLKYTCFKEPVPVLKPVRGVRELTRTEKQLFHTLMFRERFGETNIPLFGETYNKEYERVMWLGNDDLITDFFNLTRKKIIK